MSDFDRLLNLIREESVDAGEAGARVRAKLEAELSASAEVARLDSCGDFRSLFPAYRSNALSEARRMLVEDHLHSCVACRRAFEGPRAVVPIASAKKPVRFVPWAIAAAAVLVVGIFSRAMLDRALAPSGARATIASIDGELYRVSDSVPLRVGSAVYEKDELRTGKGSRAVVMLRDGSRIEMAERSDLSLTERWSGKTVNLVRGAVMIEAAKQRRGRLEVATADCLVSVKGTIFEVDRGTKGSRVSVVEGEVKVDQDGESALLHRGDQKSTSAAMAKTTVAQEVAWSENSAKYLALLGELSAISKRIEKIPGPGLRYESKLARLLPADTIIYAAIPNLGSTLGEATAIFEDRAAKSEVLREWWNEKQNKQLQYIVKQVKTFSDYLGDEIVLAMPKGAQAPVLIAEVKKPNLKQFLQLQFAAIHGAGEMTPVVVDTPGASVMGPAVMVHGNIFAMGMNGASLARVAQVADSGDQGGFLSTPLWARVSQSYASGAGWIFAADMEQMLGNHVPVSSTVNNATNIAGVDNVRYLVIERKDNMGRPETGATLDFAGARHGLMNWLAAPGPMGTLEYVSPEASFAGSFVVKNPASMIAQLLPSIPANDQALVNSIAASLGGEMTIAVDGPLLPTPAWKIAVEVNDPAQLEAGLEQAAQLAQVQIAKSTANGRTYYKATPAQIAYEVDYTYTDGYLLMAPSQALLDAAIETKATGAALSRSAAFRAQLPQDGHVNFSALLYYNMGVQAGPIVDQLKGLMTPEQQKAASSLVSNREPGLIYAYGEPDRIAVASRSGFFGLGLDTLLGLNAKGAGAFSQLLPPVLAPALRMNGSRN